jgi:hypothetical protein
MKTLLALLALFTATIATSEAKVLIYRGTSTARTGPLNIRPTVSNFFMVLDTETNQAGFIQFFVSRGQRLQSADNPIAIQMATAAIASGRSATSLSIDVSTAGTANDFKNGLFYLRGTNSTLKVASTGLTTLNLPRVFAGSNIQTGISNGTGFFSEERYVFTYLEAQTVAANNEDRAIIAVLKALSDGLKAKGFQTP